MLNETRLSMRHPSRGEKRSGVRVSAFPIAPLKTSQTYMPSLDRKEESEIPSTSPNAGERLAHFREIHPLRLIEFA